MYEEKLNEMIDSTCSLGYLFVKNDFDIQDYEAFNSSLENTINVLSSVINVEDYIRFKLLNHIKSTKPSQFKISFIEKIFYYKKYQFRFKENLIKNTPEHIKKRYVLDVIENLSNLKYENSSTQ